MKKTRLDQRVQRIAGDRDPIEAFFQQLDLRGSVKELMGITGTCRFDIEGIAGWYLTICNGTVHAFHSQNEAELIVTCEQQDMQRIVCGEEHAFIVCLQGRMRIKGNPFLFLQVQRLFPTPIWRQRKVSSLPEHPTKALPSIADLRTGNAPKGGVIQPKAVNSLSGNTFVVSDARGDIDAQPVDMQGLFGWDTRYLSRWKLTINGITLTPLSTYALDYYAAKFFLVPSTGTIYIDTPLSVIRTRQIHDGFREDITILNHADEAVELEIRVDIEADFADLFEIKDALTKAGEYYRQRKGKSLVLGYQRGSFKRETWITPDEQADINEQALIFYVSIDPQGQWTTAIDVITAPIVIVEPPSDGLHLQWTKQAMRDDLKGWLAQFPHLSCEWEPLEKIYQRSLVDLAALRFSMPLLPECPLPAAGLPWFMTIFGRDSIITSYQALPFAPQLARATLIYLAAFQGTRVDDFRDEEPGKILHELRFGEMTAFKERPQSPYFGTADATPLFLILLDEYAQWTGDYELVRQMEGAARGALEWIDCYGDRNGDGYIEYNRRNTQTGLENQGWKDSWNSILFADGTLAKRPHSLCEIQGYVYDAKRRCARLARTLWADQRLAERLEHEAQTLQQRFNRDFWVDEQYYFALALDDEGRQVDALTSNVGHLLWSGIVDQEKARYCARHLMSERLFSGWGVRTMSTEDTGYNPVGYHIGTIWPHDNSLIVLGLARYGYREEAARIALGILQAALYFQHRLPEAFAGYPRHLTRYPVEYPTSCSPQAWATGAPLLLLRALLGLEPTNGRLLVDPALPKELGWVTLLDIPGCWGRCDAFGRGKLEIVL